MGWICWGIAAVTTIALLVHGCWQITKNRTTGEQPRDDGEPGGLPMVIRENPYETVILHNSYSQTGTPIEELEQASAMSEESSLPSSGHIEPTCQTAQKAPPPEAPSHPRER